MSTYAQRKLAAAALNPNFPENQTLSILTAIEAYVGAAVPPTPPQPPPGGQALSVEEAVAPTTATKKLTRDV